MLDVLMYLFENYMVDGDDYYPARDELEDELNIMGFSNGEIGKAFNWLEDLSKLCDTPEQCHPNLPPLSIRQYTSYECGKINPQVQGLLLSLEQAGMINLVTREIIIDRLIALDIEDADTENAKWVIMMVLCNTNETDNFLELAEELVFDGLSMEKH